MTTKAEFNAEEWSRVLEGPFVAALTVIAADRGGTVRETVEMGKVYAEEREDTENPELLREILRDRPSVDPERFKGEGEGPKTPEEVRTRAHEMITEALATLEGRATPEEFDAYKRFMLEVAQRVAERTKSGGVLGVGGKRVSDEEQVALDALAATLGVSASG